MHTAMATPAAANTLPTVQLRRISIGERIHAAGTEGIAWRVKSGAVRLDRVTAEGSNYAGLALRGDVIGAETLLFGKYSFAACAIGDCELEPWLAADKELSGESLLQTLAGAERRAADALALRAGEAFERVRRLCLLLARYCDEGRKEITIPELRDMAAITNLTEETVSRAMSRLCRLGMLQRQGRRHGLVLVAADPAFAI
ncbi:MAG: Crp/Fnr family transcriptional regulator [Betaproteobacteria bacterium]|nr:Crp/Fnr family transcriptional regulator [Betaproteobacteria bacterium]